MPFLSSVILLCLARLAVAAPPAELSGGPIRIHPENPHYLLYGGKPAVLITSAEHYGAMINKDFDYVAYFDTLKSFGLNYTRIYPGAMFEPQGKFLPGNTLGPKPWSLIVPGRGVTNRGIYSAETNSTWTAGMKRTSRV